MNHYIVIQGENIYELTRKVNEVITQGYEPVGNFCVAKKWWHLEFLNVFFSTKQWWCRGIMFCQPVSKRRFEGFLGLAKAEGIKFSSVKEAWRAYKDNKYPGLKKKIHKTYPYEP